MSVFHPRVLLIAEMCNPDWVSVPLEGYSLYRALCEVSDLHLVTHERNRENLLKAGVAPGRLTTLDTSAVDAPLGRVGALLRGQAHVGWTTFTALGTLSYYLFEELLWRRWGAQLEAGAFDIVHRLTPISPTTPSLLAGRCEAVGVPFVVGPMNGGLAWPRGYGAQRRREREWLSYVREAHKLLPGYQGTRRHAAALLTGSRATREQVPARWQHKTVYVPENAVDVRRFGAARASPPAGGPLRVCFVGRLVPYKGADMLLEAAAPLVKAGLVRVEVMGDGVEAPRLRAQVAREGLGEGVEFTGWVKHQELQGRLARNQVFAFPSIREFGGAVVAEAMALGLVPVVVDYGGPGELVSEASGFAVPLGGRERIVEGFREVLLRLVEEPALLVEKGRRARERILEHFTWEAKARQVREVYRWVLRLRDKPDWGMPLPDVIGRGVEGRAEGPMYGGKQAG